MYMDKQDLALNNLQGLMCHKTQPNLTRLSLGASIVLYPPFTF